MKQYSKKLFSLVVLCGTASGMLHADDNNNFNRVAPFLQWRSQGRDMARKLYGTTSYAVYQGDQDGVYGTFNVTVQYDQAFRQKEITQALFGASVTSAPAGTTTTTTNSCNNDCNDEFITISGLGVAGLGTGRGTFDWMAENFLLPRDFKSTISFSPKVQDVVVDFNLFVGLDRWVNGLYFRLYGPVVWNKTSLRANENVINAGTASTFVTTPPVTTPPTVLTVGGGYTQGYFDPSAPVPTQSLFTQALNFFGGCQFPIAPYFVPQPVVGPAVTAVTVQPLKFAKFSDCNLTTTSSNSCDNDCNSSSHHKTGFAELRGEFGWNYIQEKYRFLINIQAAAPTGSRPKAEFLLPAQIGNGKHWELGVGIGGAWRMWCSEDTEKSFNFIIEADITHLFKAKQERTFDLKCKPNSRYMLAEQLVSNTAFTEESKLVAPSNGGFQFPDSGGVYAPVANFSTRDVKVSIGVQGDLVAMFNYTVRGFSWDLGYNFWAMSSSKISLSDDCDNSCGITPFPANTWALKGDASIAGYNPSNIGVDGFIVGLGATESAATIFTGTNAGKTLPLSNPGIDPVVTPAVIFAGTPPATIPLFVFDATGVGTTPINTSVPPVFISSDDFDLASAEQRGLSHKVFTHFSYTWRECSDRWMPYVGAGFSAEFGSHSGNDNDCSTTTTPTCDMCPSSLSFALSKWAVEIKGGVSFH